MERVVSWMWFLLTPEDSIQRVSRGIFFACIKEGSGYLGKIKAVLWIIIAIAVSCAVACLHS